MSHQTTLSQEAVVAALDAVTKLLDTGEDPAVLLICQGQSPQRCEDGAEGKILATIHLDPVAFKPAELVEGGAVAVCAGLPKKVHADNSGTAQYFVVLNGKGAIVLMGSVGTVGADLLLDTTNIVEKQSIEIAEYSLAMGCR